LKQVGIVNVGNRIFAQRCSVAVVAMLGWTSAQAATGNSVQSITGTGSATQSILGTGNRGMSILGTGSATQSILGTGSRGMSILGTGSATQGITGTGSSGMSYGGQLVALGPLDQINVELGMVEVLGQTIAVTELNSANLAVGAMVSVFGNVLGDGFIVGSAIFSTGEQYVPGSTPVFVSGYASESQVTIGRVQIGNLEIDHNAAANVSFDNGVISFFGIQPVRGGLFLAE
jgi:hypothetical protein